MSTCQDYVHREISVAPGKFDAFPESSGLYFDPVGWQSDRWRYSAKLRRLADQVRRLMQESLTPSQREAVIMYFLEGKTQRQIAERLGISQQAVSAHLFGKMRRGRRVGGAIRALRRACGM